MNTNAHNCVDTLKREKNIKVINYKGFWSVIDDYEGYVLLEHNTYGDESFYLVVKAKDFIWKEISANKVVPFFDQIADVYETYDDIKTCLEDMCII